jgi:RNA-binding protein YhbY
MAIIRAIQLGKNGVSEGFIESLKKQFVNSQNVRISVLKSCCRDKKELEEIKNKILDELGKNYTARTIGYTIALKKWRKSREAKE